MFRQRAKGSLKLSDFPLELKLRIFENIMEYPSVITSDVFNKQNILLILKLLYPCLFKKFYSMNVIDIRFVRTPRIWTVSLLLCPRSGSAESFDAWRCNAATVQSITRSRKLTCRFFSALIGGVSRGCASSRLFLIYVGLLQI